MDLLRNSLFYSVYFAPRGKKRLLLLGNQISQRYLKSEDLLIGFVGEAGAGKSLLIKGMFPGLELTNDDEGVNIRPLPLLDEETSFFSRHTYHVDIRFEMAFTQIHELVDAVKSKLANGKRVIIEHFDLIYPYLDMNAEMLIGIGEEIFITRPSVFGPLPSDIKEGISESVIYRKMAHTAEDITVLVLEEEFGIEVMQTHDDILQGFVLILTEKPDIDLDLLQDRVKEIINKNLDVSFYDDNSIKLGDKIIECSGPRIHVSNTSEIEKFRLVKNIKYNAIHNTYLLAGLVGYEKNSDDAGINQITKVIKTDMITGQKGDYNAWN